MLIAYNTDAPIYHFPFATLGLIAINVFVWLWELTVDPSVIEPLILQHGAGLHPAQWITSNFLHAGLFHLLGNMAILWGFGLVIEGKLGWWRFLLVFFGIGIAECAIEQTLALGLPEGGSLGSSAVIFGLIAMALVWAPRNEISFVLVIFIRPIFFEMSIIAFAGLSVALQLIFWWLSPIAISTELMHLLGGAIGLLLGLLFLGLRWVDCEGWDAFSVWAGKHQNLDLDELRALDGPSRRPSKSRKPKPAAIPAAETDDALCQAALSKFNLLLDEGRGRDALFIHRAALEQFNRWQLPEPKLKRLMALLIREQHWDDVVPVAVEYLRTYPQRAVPVRLKLAEVLLRHLERPAQALHVLHKISGDSLDLPMSKYRARLEQLAQRMREDGVLEMATEDW